MTTHGDKRSVRLNGIHKLAVLFVVAACLSGSGEIGNKAAAAIAPPESTAAMHSSSIQPASARFITVATSSDRPLPSETQPTVNISADSGFYQGVVQLLFAGLIVWIIVLLRGGK